MSTDELQEKVLDLERYKILEEKKREREELHAQKELETARKVLIKEVVKTKKDVKRSDAETVVLSKVRSKIFETEAETLEKKDQVSKDFRERVGRLDMKHEDIMHALKEKMTGQGLAKGRHAHLAFALKSLSDQSLVTPLHVALLTQNSDDTEQSIALENCLNELKMETDLLVHENGALRHELDEARSLLDNLEAPTSRGSATDSATRRSVSPGGGTSPSQHSPPLLPTTRSDSANRTPESSPAVNPSLGHGPARSSSLARSLNAQSGSGLAPGGSPLSSSEGLNMVDSGSGSGGGRLPATAAYPREMHGHVVSGSACGSACGSGRVPAAVSPRYAGRAPDPLSRSVAGQGMVPMTGSVGSASGSGHLSHGAGQETGTFSRGVRGGSEGTQHPLSGHQGSSFPAGEGHTTSSGVPGWSASAHERGPLEMGGACDSGSPPGGTSHESVTVSHGQGGHPAFTGGLVRSASAGGGTPHAHNVAIQGGPLHQGVEVRKGGLVGSASPLLQVHAGECGHTFSGVVGRSQSPQGVTTQHPSWSGCRVEGVGGARESAPSQRFQSPLVGYPSGAQAFQAPMTQYSDQQHQSLGNAIINNRVALSTSSPLVVPGPSASWSRHGNSLTLSSSNFSPVQPVTEGRPLSRAAQSCSSFRVQDGVIQQFGQTSLVSPLPPYAWQTNTVPFACAPGGAVTMVRVSDPVGTTALAAEQVRPALREDATEHPTPNDSQKEPVAGDRGCGSSAGSGDRFAQVVKASAIEAMRQYRQNHSEETA